MATKTIFDKVKVKSLESKTADEVFASGEPVDLVADAAVATTDAAAISASANDVDGAKLSDVQALRAKFNTLRAEVVTLKNLVNAMKAGEVEFKIMKAS